MIKVSLDVKIKQLRTEKGWSQEDLGRKLGMTRVNVSNYERGRISNLPSTVLLHLADLFNVTVDYLLGRSDERMNENFKSDWDYPRLRYDTATNEKEKKDWKDFIKVYNPALYEEIEKQEEKGA